MEDNFNKALHINKELHGKGFKLFSPSLAGISKEKYKELVEWCYNRYENINSYTRAFEAFPGIKDVINNEDYIGFILEDYTPKEKIGDAYKFYQEKGKEMPKTPYTNSYKFTIHEFLFYVAKELDILSELEFSDDFIDKILKY